MESTPFSKSTYRTAVSKIRDFVEDCHGLAALEFAFIAPLMIVIYVGTVEISQVLTLDRRVTAIASATSDLIAQEEEMDQALLEDIFSASRHMIVPYDPASVSIVVTSALADPNTGKIKVGWSRASSGGEKRKQVTVPDGLVARGESVILTDVSYSYTPIIGHIIPQGFTIRDRIYVKPRRTKVVRWVGE